MLVLTIYMHANWKLQKVHVVYPQGDQSIPIPSSSVTHIGEQEESSCPLRPSTTDPAVFQVCVGLWPQKHA